MHQGRDLCGSQIQLLNVQIDSTVLYDRQRYLHLKCFPPGDDDDGMSNTIWWLFRAWNWNA